MFWLAILLIAVIGYLLGNLNGAILISKYIYKEDVREHGSGNAGLTNFLRSYGGAMTFVVLLIDVLKAVGAALIGGWLLNRYGYYELGKMLGGFFAVIGHMFPVFFNFRGGKGILSCCALAGAMDLRLMAVVLGIFLVVVIATRYVSLGSCLAAAAYAPLFVLFFPGNLPVILIALLLALAAIYMHRENIKRLLAGTENKLSFRKKHDV